MENIKKLEEIRKYLKEYNDNWWNNERKDLDLKYYIPTDIMCEVLSNYEIGISKEVNEIIKERNNCDYATFYDESNYFTDLVREEKAEYMGSDNTYNHSSNVQNDFQWHTFKINDKYIVLLAFHIAGDIRGNYTDFIVLEFEYDTEFLEVMNDIPYEYGLIFDLEVDNKIYEINPLPFDENLEVYDREVDENIYGIYCVNDEEVTEQIREKILERKE